MSWRKRWRAKVEAIRLPVHQVGQGCRCRGDLVVAAPFGRKQRLRTHDLQEPPAYVAPAAWPNWVRGLEGNEAWIGVEPVGHFYRHSKRASPTASQRPEELGVLARGRGYVRAVGKNQFHAEHIVCTVPHGAGEGAVPTSEHVPACCPHGVATTACQHHVAGVDERVEHAKVDPGLHTDGRAVATTAAAAIVVIVEPGDAAHGLEVDQQ